MDYRTRPEWGATYDVSGRALMTGLPVKFVFIHHTVTTATGDPDADMRSVEAVDIAKFGVPSYSYVVHPSGVVFEGMDLHRGAHTIDNNGGPLRYGFNDIAFGIAFIGNYEQDDPTQRALDACRDLIDNLRVARLIQDTYTIRGHRDVYATACPGSHLYPRLTELYPIPTEDDDMPKATYVQKQGAGEVYLAGLTIPPRHVTDFAAAEYHANREGVTLIPPPTDARVQVTDGAGQVRWVMVLGDSTLFGF